MLEGLCILTAVDAGTRVGRCVLQDTIDHVWKRSGDLSWRPADLVASAVVVELRGSFLSVGTTDQLLTAIASVLATTLLIEHGRARCAGVAGIAVVGDLVVTVTASHQEIFSGVPALGCSAQRERYADALAAGEVLAPATDAAQTQQVVTGSTTHGVLQPLFAVLVLVVPVIAAVTCTRAVRAQRVGQAQRAGREVVTHGAPHVSSRLVEPSGTIPTAAEERAVAEHLAGSGRGRS